MNQFLNNFSSTIDYYKLLYKLSSNISNLKLSYIIVFIFILILSAFFEISLLGFLYFLLKALLDPNYYQGKYYFKIFLDFFDIKSSSELILYLSICFILTCIVAGAIRILFIYLLTKIVYFFGNKISNICYQKILYEDYINLYSKNSNDTLSIFQKMPIINNSVYVTLLMIYNLVNFTFIFVILLFIDIQITLYAILAFTFFYLFIILIFKNRIYTNGSIVSEEQVTNIKILRETFNGFRDILINNYRKFYNNLFKKSYSRLIRGNEENRFLFAAPRPILDTFLLSTVGIIISINFENYSNLEKLIPIFGVIVVASQRILPILNQLYQGHMNNVDATPHTNFIYNFIKGPNPNSNNNKKFKSSIKLKKQILFKNVSFSYNEDGQNEILKDINLNIKCGSRIGIIGKSGSGKSTFADLILGLLSPSKGKILVDGKSILGKENIWYKNVAGVPQNIFITQQSIAENIAFGVNIKKINFKNLKNSAKKAEISKFIEDRKDKYFSLIGEKGLKISAGQRQRLAIARALYKKSKLIVFDEPTSALDVKSENNILNTIFTLSRQKYTLILISHKISNLKKCDHIYKIDKSRLYKVK